MAMRFISLLICVCFITACGGSGSSVSSSRSSLANSISTTSSSSVTASSSSATAIRQQINPREAKFFQEAGLWLGYTKVDARNRFAQDDPQKPFLETRLTETSVNTYLFTPASSEIAEGLCVFPLDPEQTKDGFRNMLFDTPVANELYCVTDDHLFREVDGSYTVEYHCGSELVATTRLVKVSSVAAFNDNGLILGGAQVPQSGCFNWNLSHFEFWSLDAQGRDIQLESDAHVFNGIQLRTGINKHSVLFYFRNIKSAWKSGVYDLAPHDFNDPMLIDSAAVEVLPANAGLDVDPQLHISVSHGELRLDRIEPLRMSGSFLLHESDNKSISGIFSFDVSEYFTE